MLVGYNLYFVPLERDCQTGEEWEGEPWFLRLSYGSYRDAEDVKKILEKIYTHGQVIISVDAHTPSLVE